MLSNTDFAALVEAQGPLVIDGALATELEVRGHDLNHALWSAKVLRDDPQSILDVHLDYYLAGADVAITASYQASTQGLIDHFAMTTDEAATLVRRSVELAHQARTQTYERGGVVRDRRLLVAGSVGPYGAYLANGSEYRGDYVLSALEFRNFHRPRIAALVEAGVDLLAVETMPSLAEIEAVLDLLANDFPNAIAWIGCTVKDGQCLSDGSPLAEVVETIARQRGSVVAVGINCVPTSVAAEALRSMADAAARFDMPLVCYPNSGETWDASTKTWHGAQAARDGMGDQVDEWVAAGARLIGGCCRTGPRDIEAIAKALKGRG
nr:homocysteine s-methyltransferase [Quercus suber]